MTMITTSIEARQVTLGAAEKIIIGSAEDVYSDVAVDVGQIGTAIEIAIGSFTAFHRGDHIADYQSIIAAARLK